MKRFLLSLCLLFPLAAAAGPAEDAAKAAEALDAARENLARVEGNRNRVRALTDAIVAVEQGMAAMRLGLRSAAIRERSLRQRLTQQEAEIARLLATLQQINRTPESSFILHPMGPIGTARSGMVLADVAPALQAQADALKVDLREVQFLSDLQTKAQDTLLLTLTELQDARVALSQAI